MIKDEILTCVDYLVKSLRVYLMTSFDRCSEYDKMKNIRKAYYKLIGPKYEQKGVEENIIKLIVACLYTLENLSKKETNHEG